MLVGKFRFPPPLNFANFCSIFGVPRVSLGSNGKAEPDVTVLHFPRVCVSDPPRLAFARTLHWPLNFYN